MRLHPAIIAGFLAGGTTACGDLPKDPDGTIQRLRAGEPVRAGLVAGVRSSEPARAIVEDAARSLGTTTKWRIGQGEALLHDLEAGRLDVVVGNFAKKSPWMKHVALSDVIGTAEPADNSEPALRLARQNGENGWIALLDGEIAR